MRRRERMRNPKCLGGDFPDTFSARSAHLTGLKIRRITAPSHVCSLSPKVTPYHIVVWNAALCITANSAANVSVGSFTSFLPSRHVR